MNGTRRWVRVVVVAGALLGGIVLGAALWASMWGGVGSRVSVDTVASEPQTGGVAMSGQDVARAPDAVEDSEAGSVESKAISSVPEGDRQVIRVASVSLRVEDLPKALASVRRAAAASGASIESLVYDAGPDPTSPVPAQQNGVERAPQSASVVLRVPAARLAALTGRVLDLGDVLAQSAAQQDVTQQVVDVEARLRNLRAEEARVRSFLARANKVSEMLAIERELGRLRGEIESLQAQADLLARQTAMATLTVELSEPGAVVSPAGTDWGFAEAITRGVRAAAGMLAALLSISIAVLPLAALGVVIWIVVRAIVRRRSPRVPAAS